MRGEPCPALYHLITIIGPCRFVGRINAGIIDPEVGYITLRKYVYDQQHPPSVLRRLWRRIIT